MIMCRLNHVSHRKSFWVLRNLCCVLLIAFLRLLGVSNLVNVNFWLAYVCDLAFGGSAYHVDPPTVEIINR